jgi:hypothetical protein
MYVCGDSARHHQIFLMQSARKWNMLPVSVLPTNYNLGIFKDKAVSRQACYIIDHIITHHQSGEIGVKCLTLLLPPTLIPLSGVGTTCLSSCCDKDSAIILRPAACLTSTFLETGVGANANATGTNGLACLPKHGGARDYKFWSFWGEMPDYRNIKKTPVAVVVATFAPSLNSRQ